ncbi:MAG TPA: glycerophosphodiester phosphodiesterase family protein [Candidatus Hydrogenedentes bacterium]|nr:glycerophosphodiester phosphodiesterase family protein [Candidatus Hydrogenedentota bacterium]HNT88040.1 glycerophosphodiester phosphodiesterase family protein [Candidatus Hydrogenedentota bacterium]
MTQSARIFALAFLLSCLAFSGFAEPRACAHRGDVAAAPENTMPAFASAVRKRAPMIEFDVQKTKDGYLVIMHDESVDRTTNGKGMVADLTFDEVRALDAGAWFSPEFTGTRVPTFEETLDAIPPGILCNVHLKMGPKLAADAARIIKVKGRLVDCFLACTEDQAIEAKAVVPEIRICNMTRQGTNRKAYVDRTIELGSEFIQLPFTGGLDGLKEDVDRLHAAGVTVNWFHATKEPVIRAVAAAGVDYLLTDDLDLCMRVLKECGRSETGADSLISGLR